MVKQAIRVEDILWSDAHLEDLLEGASPLEVVRELKNVHRVLGGMAIYFSPEDRAQTLAACCYAISHAEAGLARAKIKLQEEADDDPIHDE